jgi:tRNA1(Val) A37 N6-methylase TrmN6
MDNRPYNKYNFILSCIGFIGSLGFYFGVLKELDNPDPQRELIEQLKRENTFLKQHIKELTHQIPFNMNAQNNTAHSENAYLKTMIDKLEKGAKLNRTQTEKLAHSFGVLDKTKIKELTELAIVESARSIALSSATQRVKFEQIVALYERQTNLSFRTSQSILLKQYSTPAPIGYLMGLYCGIDSHKKSVFEPSAGNGLLTIATKPTNVVVNEIDTVRNENLKRSKYKTVLKQDGSVAFTDYTKHFDAVITNPPFGSVGKAVYKGTYRIYNLDHYMATLALDTMKDSGKCAFIIGGHTGYDGLDRINSGKNRIFFNYLYHHYNVQDVIPINGAKLYSRQGTSFDTRLVLINGRKQTPAGFAPKRTDSLSTVVNTFDELYERVTAFIKGDSLDTLELEAQQLLAELQSPELDGAYIPSSKAGTVLQTQVPDSMDYEVHQALEHVTSAVGGDMDNFVRHRLGYHTKADLVRALSAEQIDAVGMAIYNIEALNQAIIIGDQTGIGKGRIAGAIIRYATQRGLKPIFLTEKANLFSDLYRDLSAIGSDKLKPFIVNSRETKTDIKDEDGIVIYQAPLAMEQNSVFESKNLSGYDFVMATYSQFNSPDRKSTKPHFLSSIATDNIIVMDESHNASGLSKTGAFMQTVLAKTMGACFLSATFAKRPDNMPIYAMKTAISEANMSKEDLVDAILTGGVALQEVLASQLVAEGQMIRRERSYEGIEVNYITLSEKANEQMAIADNITQVLRDIIDFQTEYVDNRVSELDQIASAKGMEVEVKAGTENGGVDNMPYFSKVFNVINQMLFSIKAESVADRAIMRLKEGKKPVIAFSSTMGSFLEQMEGETTDTVSIGDSVSADFALVLQKGLDGVLRYTVTAPDGTKEHAYFELYELGQDAQNEYERITKVIQNTSTGISISPIDVIIQRIEKAGYSVAEVTGRKIQLKLNSTYSRGIVEPRRKVNTNDAFREFNNNQVDVLLINQSGSTGASAHAIVTSKVPKDKVKQRVMIVLQPELDINIEIQKRGRINRTGQILKPIYDYVNSAIPAELRLMMMLQKKLKSLDANTSSNQKQSSGILDVPDFLNKYGDAVVTDYLKENELINRLLGNPLKIGSDEQIKEDGALKVSGRIAVLPIKMQEAFYNEIKEMYDTQVNYLKQTGEYDLEVEEMDLKAETISSSVVKIGRGGLSSFGEDSILEKVNANNLRKPFKVDELNNLITQSLEGRTPQATTDQLIVDFNVFHQQQLDSQLAELKSKYTAQLTNIQNEKKIQLIQLENPSELSSAIAVRKQEIDEWLAKSTHDVEVVMANKKQTIVGNFNYFKIGKRLLYPVDSFDGSKNNQLAVFLGFKIDKKRKNPYAPSAMSLRLAIASSQKYLEIPMSKNPIISGIKGESSSIYDRGIENTLATWQEYTQKNSSDRRVRYIVTGNILQAFAHFHGKLVSYTTLDGRIEKGILMPDYWDVAEATNGKIEVPISSAIKVFQSMPPDKSVTASHNLTIIKTHENDFKLYVNSSLKEGGQVFLNADILQLVHNNNFEKIGNSMVTTLPFDKIGALLSILETQLGASVKLSESEIENVGLVKKTTRPVVKIDLPPKEDDQSEFIRILELEAEALILELELLAYKSSKKRAS